VALANSEMASKRILVVDDMAIISQGTALMLESFGYSADKGLITQEVPQKWLEKGLNWKFISQAAKIVQKSKS